MCGRYATSTSTAELEELFAAVDETGGELAPDYNVAPTDRVPVVRVSERAGGRVLSAVRWGLVPPWAGDTRGAARMINARAETVATSRAFAPSFARRRCLVPADGWFEWRRLGSAGAAGSAGPSRSAGRGRQTRQAYFMTPRGGGVLAFAGLWSVWGRGDERLLTCSIVTTAAIGELAAVHDRMPLTLPPQRWAEWLDHGDGASAGGSASGSVGGSAGASVGGSVGGSAGVDAGRLLAPPPEDFLASLEIRPVGPEVGDVRNGGPELVQRISAVPLDRSDEEPTDLTLF